MRNERLQSNWKIFKKQRMLFLFLLPAIVTLLVFSYTPMMGLIMAFQDYKVALGFSGSPFVGLKNFEAFLRAPDFYNALKNTLGISILSIVFGFPAPIVLALLIDEVPGTRFKRFCQTITYLPHFVSWVILATLAYRLLDIDSGIVNLILSKIGLQPIAFMRESALFWPILIVISIWKEIGWNSIIYLATISNLDPGMYDSAKVDGAGRFKRMFYITLPSLAPIFSLMFILNLGTLFRVNFDAVFNLMNPMVMDSAEVIDTFVYRMGIKLGRYSYATAIGFAQSAISFILVYFSYRYSKILNDGDNGL